MTVSGAQTDDAVQLSIWFDGTELANFPIECDGVIDPDERLILGAWKTPCVEPDTCGCDGGGGSYKLHRIDPDDAQP